jgi:hypothetical protein
MTRICAGISPGSLNSRTACAEKPGTAHGTIRVIREIEVHVLMLACLTAPL